MRIVYCIDSNYTEMCRASIKTYKRYNPLARVIVVSETPIDNIGYDENIIIKLPKMFRNRGFGDRITNTAYLKLFLTDLPYKKILYVDADTKCQKKLDDLYNIPCEYINICESHSFGEKQAKALGLLKYANTGIMVMNLDNLRKIDFKNKCLEVEKSDINPETGWQHDETCINVAMKGKLNFIDKKFNYCHARKYSSPIREEDAYILHYIGKDKVEMFKEKKYPELIEIGKEIEGKRVAIVGNARSIFTKKNGEKIDDHDFVIRFNRGFIVDKNSQGKRTDLLLLACNLTSSELNSYHARFACNRSNHYYNPVRFTINNYDRALLKERIGKQPSTGFMAIDICLYFGASEIDLYGFDWGKTDTFYNPEGYVTKHDYSTEEKIIRDYERQEKLRIL